MKYARNYFLLSFIYSLTVTGIFGQQVVPGNIMAVSKGNAYVNDIGAATYSLNINCAAGLGGLQPHLVLSYNSQSGTGPLGIGWSIQGISAISRSGRTWEQDGGYALISYTNGRGNPTLENTINFNSFDRFTLDGEELRLAYDTVPVSSSPFINYGLPKTIYYTEQNTFNKVVLIDTASNSPTYFKVFSKDGLIKEYGNSVDSKILLNSNTLPIHWFLNKVTDRNGNFIKYTYANNFQTGEYYPIKIEYSGNSSLNKATSDSIVFVYETNQVTSRKFIKGASQETNKNHVSQIICYSYGKIIRKYTFTYQTDYWGTTSQLTNIQECGLDGICFSPIGITWNHAIATYNKNDQNLIDPNVLIANTGKQYLTGDLNGDGLTDIMTYDPISGENTVLLSRQSSTAIKPSFIKVTNPISTNSIKKGILQFVDLNADGKSDVFFCDKSSGILHFYLTDFKSGNLTFTDQQLPSTTYNTLSYLIKGTRDYSFFDYNNDGLPDFVIYQKVMDSSDFRYNIHPDDFTVFLNKTFSNPRQSFFSTTLNTGNLEFDMYQVYLPSDLPNRNKWHYILSDVDNNSYTDLFLYNTNTKSAAIVYNYTNSFFRKDNFLNAVYQYDSLAMGIKNVSFINPNNSTDPGPIANLKSSSILSLQDINADGLPDLLLYDPSGTFEFWINKGNYSFELLSAGLNLGVELKNNATFNSFEFKDVNFDGLPDVCLYSNLNGGNKIYINQGLVKGFQLSVEHLPSDFFQTGISLLEGHFTSQLVVEDFTFSSSTGINYQWSVQSTFNTGINSINSISEGNSISYTYFYSNLSDSSVYKRLYNYTVYPNTEFQNTYPVVAKMLITDGILGLPIQTFSYKYQGAVTNLLGRGFRGFSKKYEVREDNSGNPLFTTIKSFMRDSSSNIFIGDPLTQIQVIQANGKLVSQSDYKLDYKFYPRNSFGMSFYSYTSENISKNYEIDGSLVSATRTRQEVDDYGNVTTMVVDYGNGYKDSTLNVYSNDTTNWILGRLTKATVYRLSPLKPMQVKNSAFAYNTINGQLTNETAFSELDVSLQINKSYSYDGFGNITQSDITANNGQTSETRTTITKFDTTGKYITSITNALGQTVTNKYDIYLGKPLQTTDYNGLVTKYSYDGIGRLTKTVFPDNNWQTIDYKYFNTNLTNTFPVSSFPLGCSYVIYRQSSLSPPTIEFYDNFDRQIGVEKSAFDGTRITIEKYIDAEGKLTKESEWHSASETPQYTSYTYDLYGRIVERVAPGNRKEKITYSPNKKVITNYINQTKTLIQDDKNQLIQAIDNIGQAINYDYDASGNLLSTTDPKNNQIINQYDSRGFKTTTTDPDLGTYSYIYNGFGEIIQQTDPKGNTVKNTYDKLGRILKKVTSEGTTQWIYDTGTKGIGKLSQITNYDNAIISYTYDTLSRMVKETKLINNKSFDVVLTYDITGRVSETAYPSGFKIKQVYNASGFLSEVRRSSDNFLYWRANKINSLGQIESQEQANNVYTQFFYNSATHYVDSLRGQNSSAYFNRFQYKFDAFGNLLSRTDVNLNKSELFKYDSLNRLTQTMIPAYDTINIAYDGIGNIISKSDVGTYEYGVAGNGPHRVLKINLYNPKCIPSNLVTTEYTSFNKVNKLYNDTARLEIFYGPDNERYMDKYYVRDTLIKTKYYIDNIYELEDSKNNKIQTHYVSGGGNIVASYVSTNNSGKSMYWFKDQLGSITTITDSTGKILQSFSYDAWGKRRNADWTDIPDSLVGTYVFDRGFTGHQQYDIFSLVNMNGRIYDPVIGRFISPDPTLQDITDLQDFNRYSYVINNPLKYTDPSGYNFLGDLWHTVTSPFVAFGNAVASAATAAASWIKENWKTIVVVTVAVTVGVLTAGVGTAAVFSWSALGSAVLSGAAAGFASNFTASMLSGQNIGEALLSGVKGAAIGALSAGLTYGVGSAAQAASSEAFNVARTGIKVAGHGIVQGEIRQLNGGRFLQGFYSGAISGVTEDGVGLLSNTPAAKVFAAAAVGGTTSAISGGNIVNGAITGAYVMMYNQGLHPSPSPKPDHDESSGEQYFDYLQRIRSGLFSSLGEIGEGLYSEQIEIYNTYWGGALSLGMISYHTYQGQYFDAFQIGISAGVDLTIGAIGIIGFEGAALSFVTSQIIIQGYKGTVNYVNRIGNDPLPPGFPAW